MADIKLNMMLLLRRGKFAETYVLKEGEPGYHTESKVLKVGDGVTIWKDLPFANQSQVNALIVANKLKTAEKSALSIVDDTISLKLNNTDTDVTLSQDENGLKATVSFDKVIGTATDLSTADTIKGAKKYTDEVAEAIRSTLSINPERIVVETLPSVDEAKLNAIYMIKRTAGLNEKDLYDEYMIVTVNSVKQFELIGNTELDLSNYYTKDEIDALNHEDTNTTYTFTPTENPLEFTVKASDSTNVETITLVAPPTVDIDTGVMEIAAGTNIDVTPGENGKVTVSHATFKTGEYVKTPESSEYDGDQYFVTGVTVDNGHVTGANVRSIADVLANMNFVLDGGKADTSAEA